MFQRKQKDVSESSKHWYQDKYQHVLTQRNVLALIALVALGIALFAVFAIARLAPLKTVEPYLLQIDQKTGITQKVEPISREKYAANEAIDRYFTSLYLRARESYNPSIVSYNNNIVRLMSTRDVYYNYYRSVNSSNPQSLAAVLSTFGQRDVKIGNIAYIPSQATGKADAETTPSKIMTVDITTIDTMPNAVDTVQQWVVTITFEYASLNLNQQEQLINPLGYTVTSYQIQRKIN